MQKKKKKILYDTFIKFFHYELFRERKPATCATYVQNESLGCKLSFVGKCVELDRSQVSKILYLDKYMTVRFLKFPETLTTIPRFCLLI